MIRPALLKALDKGHIKGVEYFEPEHCPDDGKYLRTNEILSPIFRQADSDRQNMDLDELDTKALVHLKHKHCIQTMGENTII